MSKSIYKNRGSKKNLSTTFFDLGDQLGVKSSGNTLYIIHGINNNILEPKPITPFP